MALSTSTNVHVGIPFPKWSCQSTPCGKKDMSEVAQSERIPAFHKLWWVMGRQTFVLKLLRGWQSSFP